MGIWRLFDNLIVIMSMFLTMIGERKPGTPRIRPKSAANTASSAAVFQLAVAVARQWEVRQQEILRRAGLGLPHGKLLQVLGQHGPMTTSGIARRLSLSRQACQQTANRLILSGFIVKRDNPAHRRSAHLELTGRGVLLVDQMSAAPGLSSNSTLSSGNLHTAAAVLEALMETQVTRPKP